MDDTSPAPERASVTAARWALGGATAALVALASGATALLVVTSTTGVGLPLEDSRPLPSTSADGSGGSADVLLLPGGGQPSSGTRARRADTGPDDLLLVLRGSASRSPATLTGLASLRSSGDASAPPPAGGPAEDVQVLPVVEDARPEPGSHRPDADRPDTDRPDTERPSTDRPQRPARPTPAPGGTTPPAEEEPEGERPATGPGRTPAAEPRPDAPAEDDDDKDKAKGKGGDEDEKDDDEAPDDRDVPDRTATATPTSRPAEDDGRRDDEGAKKDKKDKDHKGSGHSSSAGHTAPDAG